MTDRLTYLDALQRLKDAAVWVGVATGDEYDLARKALISAAEDYADASIRTGLGDPVRLAPDAERMMTGAKKCPECGSTAEAHYCPGKRGTEPKAWTREKAPTRR